MKRLVFLAALAASTIASAQHTPDPKVVGTATGRFVMGQIGQNPNSQYLLDTQTGRVWEVIYLTDEKGVGSFSGLRQVRFYTVDGLRWGPEPPPPSK